MGQTLEKLGSCRLEKEPVFSNRFVIEIAETIHLHYRNLRIILSPTDFKELAKGFIDAFKRWQVRGEPVPKQGRHVELCRKKIASEPHNDGIKVNLNKNLYNNNKDKIYSEGAGFDEDRYIHFKWRDLRIECSIDEFNVLVDNLVESREKLNAFTKED